jgi:hypothetical protein
MNFSCVECGEVVSEKDIQATKDGAIYCSECFKHLLNENDLEAETD